MKFSLVFSLALALVAVQVVAQNQDLGEPLSDGGDVETAFEEASESDGGGLTG